MNALKNMFVWYAFSDTEKSHFTINFFSFLQVYTMDSTKENSDSAKEKSDNYRDDLLLRMGLNDNKAGMEGLDKEKINKIIMEATKVCFFFSFNIFNLVTFLLFLNRKLVSFR